MRSSSLLNTLLPCCFSNPYTSADAYLQPLTTVRPGGGGGGGGGVLGGVGVGGSSSSGPIRPPPSLEELLDASAAAREATWRSLGALEPLALSQHPSGPAAGGPKVRRERGKGGGSSSEAAAARQPQHLLVCFFRVCFFSLSLFFSCFVSASSTRLCMRR